MMNDGRNMPFQYSIFDPTGNITALVEHNVEPDLQPAVAAALMKRHPEVEQVGFVLPAAGGSPVQAELRMAGGEFCGNAAMSAAALYLLRQRQKESQAPPDPGGVPETVRLRVSGAALPVEVRLWTEAAGSFRGGVRMPPALGIVRTEFTFGDTYGTLPVVRMEGISHIIVEPSSALWGLREDREAAGRAVRDWCGALAADGLGLMFLEKRASAYRLTPLVYIPGSGTVFWENSCASGSSAAGMYLAAASGAPVDLAMEEPGGILRVESDPERRETWLYGRARLVTHGQFSPEV